MISVFVATFLLGGIAVRSGHFHPGLHEVLDPKQRATWLRYGLEVAFLAYISSKVLRLAIRGIKRSAMEELQAIEQANREYALAEGARKERAEREKTLRNALKLQSVAQLGEGFAHLFNNIITVIRTALDEVRTSELKEEKREALRAIANGAKLGAVKTKELLALTRPHVNQGATISVREELNGFREKVSERLRGNVRVSITNHLDARVALQPSWFEQILLALVLNAEQAMKAGGTVSIETSRALLSTELSNAIPPIHPGDYITLTVADQGVGMTKETLSRACEPFYTTKGRESHDGLGLTLVTRTVGGLKGGVVIDSSPNGTTVTLYLPIADAPHFCLQDSAADSALSGKEQPDTTSNSRSRQSADVAPQPLPPSSGVVAALARMMRLGRLRGKARRPPVFFRWQEATIRRLSFATFALFTVGVGFAWFELPQLRLQVASTGIPPILLLGFGIFNRHFSETTKSLLLVAAVFLTGATLVNNATYVSPAAIAVLTLSILLSAELIGEGACLLAAGSTVLAFTIGALRHTGSTVVLDTAMLDPLQASSWLRVGAFTGLMLPVFSWAVLHVVDSAQNQLNRAREAHLNLELLRRARLAEDDAALAAANEVAQVARIEAAGRLIGTIAHDLNNSLQSIVGWSELLFKDEELSAIDPDAFDVVEQSCDYAESLIQQLQLEPKENAKAYSIDISRALVRMRPMLETVLHQRGHNTLQLVSEIDEECYVRISEVSLRRILLNLVANARDAMFELGRCTIQLRRLAEQVVLVCSDTGHGMDSETLGRISEPFFTTKGELGTGLGLHSVRRLMSATSGSFEITSQLGVGTRVNLSWPVSIPLDVAKRSAKPLGVDAGKGRVLLAEDDELVREVLSRTLMRAGFSVVTARDGDEAAVEMNSFEFDLLCTDAIMPGFPTAELIDAFVARHPTSPVILISGHLPTEFSRATLTNSAVSFLGKPFTGRELLAEVTRRLSSRSAIR